MQRSTEAGDGHCFWAAEPETIASAWTLVHDAYVEAGYIRPNPHRIYSSRSALGPEAAVLCATERGEVAYTLTLVPDGALGLPLDGTYADALQPARERGERLVYCALFAQAPPRPARGALERSRDAALRMGRMLELFGRALAYGTRLGDVTLLVASTPAHASFYERLLGFDRLGPERPFHDFTGTRGVLLGQRLSHGAPTRRRTRALEAVLTAARTGPLPPRGATARALEHPRVAAYFAGRPEDTERPR